MVLKSDLGINIVNGFTGSVLMAILVSAPSWAQLPPPPPPLAVPAPAPVPVPVPSAPGLPLVSGNYASQCSTDIFECTIGSLHFRSWRSHSTGYF
ncbi:MAG: hypothetical protein ACM65M_17450 [Microcoleus sp.]